MLKDVYAAAVVNDDDKSLKAVQKLLINTTAERDYSAQETCHLLLNVHGIAGLHHSLPLRCCPAFSPAYICKRSFDRWPP